MKTAGDKAGVTGDKRGQRSSGRVAPQVLRVVSGVGSDPNRERERVPRVTGEGRRGKRDGETERGKGGSQGVGQDGGDWGGRRGLRVSE